MLVSSQFSSTVTVLNDVSTSIFYSESCKILSSTNIIDKLPSHSSIQRACFELDGSVWFIHQSNPILWYHPLIVDGLVTLNRLPKHLVMNDGWLFHNHFLSTQCDNLEPTFRVVLEVDEGWNSMVWFWGEAVHKEKEAAKGLRVEVLRCGNCAPSFFALTKCSRIGHRWCSHAVILSVISTAFSRGRFYVFLTP